MYSSLPAPELAVCPNSLGWRGVASQWLLREAGYTQNHRTGWDLPQGAESDSELQLGKITVTRGSPWGWGQCCTYLWDGQHGTVSLVSSSRQVQEAQGLESTSKHITGQEGTREWSKIYEAQTGPDQQKLTSVMKCLARGIGGGSGYKTTWLREGCQHRLYSTPGKKLWKYRLKNRTVRWGENWLDHWAPVVDWG